MAERGESSDEEPTIAEDVVVTKQQLLPMYYSRLCTYSSMCGHCLIMHVRVHTHRKQAVHHMVVLCHVSDRQ